MPDDRGRIPAGAAEGYLDRNAEGCPCCGGAIGRLFRLTEIARLAGPDSGRPVARVACYCPTCGASWTEGYKLISVEIHRGDQREATDHA